MSAQEDADILSRRSLTPEMELGSVDGSAF